MSHSRSCSSSEPSFSLDSKVFDVFLSFGGPDTRHGFVRRLYRALVEKGIHTFLDRENLEKGDHIPTTLERGINESRVCIPILSKRFPESKWCLEELSLMVKSGVKICPLFYDVLPTVLRCRDDSDYAEYLKEYKKKGLSDELILEYKNALKGVSNLCGWCFNQFDGSGEGLIREVVTDVKKSLHSSNPYKVYLDIPKCFGLDWPAEHLKRIINGLFLQKKMVKVGLHGMSGIGKTTLAKIVCKDLPFSQFQLFSFVPSVGERCQGANGLVNLQNQMLRDVMAQFRGEVDHVDEGKSRLEECLGGKKVLLLLDDIENDEQLEALAGNYRGLGERSCVIITSRDEQILKVANADLVYEVGRLSHKYAMDLFNFHAFSNSGSPDQELQTLSDIVSACEGLPLALQTFGRLLVGEKDKDVWKEMVGKISCEPSIQKKLRVSYDSLDPSEKEMFQDIACFFTRRKKEIVMIFWAGLIPSPHASLRSLLQKSMVSLDPSNEFLMHRCFQDLGKSLSNEMHTEARKRTRLFDEEDAYRVLRRPSILLDRQEKAKLLRYLLYKPKQPMTLRAEMFKSLYNLQFLRLTDVSIQGHFSGELFVDLRWLSLRKYSSKGLPQGLNLQKLVILEVTHSQITHLWDETVEENSATKRGNLKETKPGNLKVLILRGCKSLKSLPATLCYTPLQMLDLRNCHSLSSLTNTVKSWTSLVKLDMEGCSVSSLPEDFGELPNLRELNLSNSHHLFKLPASFGKLTQLERLEIHHNDKLKNLPDSIGSMKSLAYLDVSYCRSLCGLPNTMGSLNNLICLEMEGCGVPCLPEDCCNLANLQELNLSYCHHLFKLPASFGKLTQLERLEIHHNDQLKNLPDSIGGLKSLAYLDVSYCHSLCGLPNTVGSLISLICLEMQGCGVPCLPEDCCNLANLQELNLSFCQHLSQLPFGFGNLSQLVILEIHHIPGLIELPKNLGSLQQITTLNLVGCNAISCGSLESCLSGLPSLECILAGGPGLSSHQLQVFYDSFKDFSFNKSRLLDSLDAPANWVHGEGGGKSGCESKCVDYCTGENKVEYCAGYSVCTLVCSGHENVNLSINRLSYSIERDDSSLKCSVNSQNSIVGVGDYFEVRLVRVKANMDFAWLKTGNKVSVNARSDYDNWKASFNFLMYEAALTCQNIKAPTMITLVM